MKNLFDKKLLLFLVTLLLPVFAFAQQQTDPPKGFDRIEQMVPMRDDVRLHTIIYAPKNRSEKLRPNILSSRPAAASWSFILPMPGIMPMMPPMPPIFDIC